MTERIYMNGTPVVGFGDEDDELAFYKTMVIRPIGGYLVGGTAGALLGALTKKRLWTGVGALLGGAGGAVTGGMWAARSVQHAADEQRAREEQKKAQP